MVDYGDIAYSQLGENGYVNGRWREDIVAEAIKQARAGQVSKKLNNIVPLSEIRLTVPRLWL